MLARVFVGALAAVAAAWAVANSSDEAHGAPHATGSTTHARIAPRKRVRFAAEDASVDSIDEDEDSASPAAEPEDASDEPASAATALPRVAGLVVDDAGRPVPLAEVSLPGFVEEKSYRLCVDWTPAGPDGRIAWSGQSRGLLRLSVRAPGFVAFAGPWLDLNETRPIDVGRIVLRRGVTVSGSVVDERHAPLGAATVDLVPDSDECDEDWVAARGGVMTAACDDDGRFEFPGLEPGRYRVRCFFPRATAVVVTAPASGLTLVVPDAVAPRQVALDVEVVDADGNPVRRFDCALADEAGHRVNISAFDGRARLDGCFSGRLTVSVESAPARSSARVEDVVPSYEPLVVRLPQPALAISGRAEVPAGFERWVGLWVSAAPADGDVRERTSDWVDSTTNEFRVEVPHAGRWLLTLIRDGGCCSPSESRAWTVADAGSSGVVLRDVAPADIFVPLERPDGAAVPNEVDITLVPADGAGPLALGAHAKTSSGGVAIEGVPPGRRVDVSIRVRDGSSWSRPFVVRDIEPGAAVTPQRVDPGLEVAGVVVRRDGSPVAAADVEFATDPAGRDAFRCRTETDLDGRFVLSGAAPGPCRLVCESDALETPAPVVIAAGSRDARIVIAPRPARF